MLGMTIACARCHDHKFDPIPTSDYYALAGIFRSTQTYRGVEPGKKAAIDARLISLADAPSTSSLRPRQHRSRAIATTGDREARSPDRPDSQKLQRQARQGRDSQAKGKGRGSIARPSRRKSMSRPVRDKVKELQ